RLRQGERLTRNWSNKGLHVNMNGGGGTPGCMTMKTGQDSLRYTPKDGDLALRMPTSYVYLTGKLKFTASGPVTVSFSDNNGMDWKQVAAVTSPGPQEVDL